MTSEQELSMLQPGSLLLTIAPIQSNEVLEYSKKQTARYGETFKSQASQMTQDISR